MLRRKYRKIYYFSVPIKKEVGNGKKEEVDNSKTRKQSRTK